MQAATTSSVHNLCLALRTRAENDPLIDADLLHLLRFYLNHSDSRTGECWARPITIQRAIGRSRTWFKRARSKLAELGYIHHVGCRLWRNGRKLRSVWCIADENRIGNKTHPNNQQTGHAPERTEAAQKGMSYTHTNPTTNVTPTSHYTPSDPNGTPTVPSPHSNKKTTHAHDAIGEVTNKLAGGVGMGIRDRVTEGRRRLQRKARQATQELIDAVKPEDKASAQAWAHDTIEHLRYRRGGWQRAIATIRTLTIKTRLNVSKSTSRPASKHAEVFAKLQMLRDTRGVKTQDIGVCATESQNQTQNSHNSPEQHHFASRNSEIENPTRGALGREHVDISTPRGDGLSGGCGGLSDRLQPPISPASPAPHEATGIRISEISTDCLAIPGQRHNNSNRDPLRPIYPNKDL